MRQIAINSISEGAVLARPVYSSSGKTLVGKGYKLTSKSLARLRTMGIHFLYIEDKRFADIVIEDVISEKTRINTMKAIRESFGRVAEGRDFDVEPIKLCARHICEDIAIGDDKIINLLDTTSADDYLYSHSVNVGILTAVIGKSLGRLNAFDMEDMVTGALLHDIGKVKHSSGAKGEVNNGDDHPVIGFNMLRGIQELSLRSAAIALQHHENISGTGFPRGLDSDDISMFAKIVSVADVYDIALAVGNKGSFMLPHEAIEVVLGLSGHTLDSKIVIAFLRNVAVYPNGITVKLSNGMYGVVVRQNRQLPQRPVIRMLSDIGLAPTDMDLSMNTTVLIDDVVV